MATPDPATPAPGALWTWLYRTVPAFDSLRTYSSETFRRDVVAGLTVAAVAVPQAMAYASIVGLPVQYGLYTAIVMTAVGVWLSLNVVKLARSAKSALTSRSSPPRRAAPAPLPLRICWATTEGR